MRRKRYRFFGISDVLVVLTLLLLATFVTLYAGRMNAGNRAEVYVDGVKKATIRLGEITRLSVEGPLGTTVIACDEAGVYVVSSPCPNHHCVRMGHARVAGQTILCVPNRVAIRVVGDTKEGFDGVVG